ncbi:MAG: putative oxidoreductase C-terminal domain-containing protein [Prolixibacteraceae bacterium]|nr:putative oxidoreductase C-terminal domain-containing protein [Prolixibacteraceae bacterium]
MKNILLTTLAMTILLVSCTGNREKQEHREQKFTGANGEVSLMILDPGHFHAALIQKFMYDQIDPVVHIYAPDGPDVKDHLTRVEGFNTRQENPTSWNNILYTGTDYFEKMLSERPGNVMVVSGNNAKKTEYIIKALESGINVLADKPMVITPGEFPKLEKAFEIAEEKGLLLYDVMTERYEITNIIQRELAGIPELFGDLPEGTSDEPVLMKESIHHFFRYVSGTPLTRPAWFFDVEQQGDGIVDIPTHLVDLIQWEAFPEVILRKEDVEIVSAKRWSTDMTPEMFKKVTQMDKFPDYLQKDVENGILKVYSNGEVNYKLKNRHAKIVVKWNFEAPEGVGDSYYSLMRGSLCNLMISQSEKEGYNRRLYIEPAPDTDPETFADILENAVSENLSRTYPGISLTKLEDKLWTIEIPEKYKVGHEEHFAKVTEKYLEYLVLGHMPEWEVPNMITKYYTTTEGLKAAR